MKSLPGKLYTIFITTFIDLLGVGVVIPIIAPLILKDGSLMPAGTSHDMRGIVLGILLSSFPIAQFFGAPALGVLSDRHGRKPILLLSVAGTALGYGLFAVGVMQGWLWLLFLARMLAGFMGGNVSIIYSSISDISQGANKARNFGLVGVAFGLGFILGPIIGGYLGNPGIVSWFNAATPFWFTMALSLVNLLMITFLFGETLRHPQHRPLSLRIGIQNIRTAFQQPDLRQVFAVVFMLTVGFNFFTQFFQVFVIHRFNWNAEQIGKLYGFIGVCSVITQGLLLRFLTRRFSSLQILNFSALLLSIALPVVLLPTQANLIFYIVPFIALSQGLTQPNLVTVVSDQVPPNMQGRILGINQSVQSLGLAIPPLIAGIINAFDERLPIITGAACTFFGWVLLQKFNRRTRLTTKPEIIPQEA